MIDINEKKNYENRLVYLFYIEDVGIFAPLLTSEDYQDMRCDCGTGLDTVYVYIINRLKKQGLLPKNYKMRCCVCYGRYRKNNHRKSI